MRTAIFVHQPSTVTISAENAAETTAELCRYRATAVPAVGTHQLAPGVYLITSIGPMKVSGVQGEIEYRIADKDDWPDPKPRIVALEPGATAGSIKHFLTILKDISPDD